MKQLSAVLPGPVPELIARPPVPVRFEGTGERRGPLTFGHLDTLVWLKFVPEAPGADIIRRLDLPPAARLEDVAESVAVILTRHEALRTRFVLGERPEQVALASGVFLIDVYEPEASGADLESVSRAGLADELGQRLRDEVAMRPGPLPLRVAIAMSSGAVLAGAVCYSHMIVDDRAAMIVGREFAELVRVPAARLTGLPRPQAQASSAPRPQAQASSAPRPQAQASSAPRPQAQASSAPRPQAQANSAPRHQPLDQAELEHGDAMRARADGTLAYWQRQLLGMPHCLYAAPRVGSTASSLMVEMSSPAVTVALRHIAARTRMSRSSAALAAICALLARRTGYRRLVFPALSGNRFERHLAAYVGTVAQSTLTVVDTDTPSFDQLAGRAWSAIVSSSRHGMYDVNRRDYLVGRIERDRGVRFDFEPIFNSTIFDDVVPAKSGAEPISRPELPDLGLTTLRSLEIPSTETMIRFDLDSVASEIHVTIRAGDTSRIPVADLEAMLLAIERILVAAAYGDLDSGRLEELIGMDPLPRGADWMFAGQSWVEESEVRRLVRDALAPNPCQVFREAATGEAAASGKTASGEAAATNEAIATGDATVTGEVLVAYAAASESLRTPAQAHDRCLGMLFGRPTVITPHRYVLCDGAPARPDDLAGWRNRALCEGTGRRSGDAEF
jgi:hypothetical protein